MGYHHTVPPYVQAMRPCLKVWVLKDSTWPSSEYDLLYEAEVYETKGAPSSVFLTML